MEITQPKAQSIKKKNFILTKFLFLPILIVVTGILLILYFKYFETNHDKDLFGDYPELNEFCQIEKHKTRVTRECEVFLKNFEEDSSGKTCISLLLLNDSSMKEVEFCVKEEGIVEWVNPYDNYDLPIPVVVNMRYKKSLLGTRNSRLKKIVIELMDDSKANKLIEYCTDVEPILYRSHHTEEMNKVANRGYYITSLSNLENHLSQDVLGVINTEIKSFFITEDGQMILDVIMYIEGKEIREEVISYGFKIFQHTDKGIDLTEKVLTGSNVSEFLELDTTYNMQVLIKEYDEWDELLVEEYLDGNLGNLEFELISLIKKNN